MPRRVKRATDKPATDKPATDKPATVKPATAAPEPAHDGQRAALQRVEEVSAGGLAVERRDDGVYGVLIAKYDRRRRLIWALPKGHVEAGETFEQTAVREVYEETGINARVDRPLGEIDYWFVYSGRRIHKTVHHFLLRRVSGELSDHDVEVAQVEWVPLAEISDRLAYADERRLVASVPALLEGV